MNKLVDIGNNGTDEMNNDCLNIEKVGDLIQGQSYYYQEYKVNSGIEMKSYSLHNLKNFPKGSYVANTQNVYQGEFLSNENFRILIPKDALIENINGQIEIRGMCKNYPIFYGEAPDGRQDYVLTYDAYGDINTSFNININTNTGSLKIIKKDADTSEKLEGVKFKLISEDGMYKFDGITNEYGEICFENLFPGKYILEEIEGLEKYNVNPDIFNIEIEYNSLVELEITNELKKGNIKIKKVDKENNEIKLDGVVFELYDENMELLESLVTNEKGEVESDFYPSENKIYFLKEIKSKDGYVLNEEIIKIELEEGKTVEYEIENKKIDIPEIPIEPEIDEPQEPIIEELPEEPSIEEIPEKPSIEELPEEPSIEEIPEKPSIEENPENPSIEEEPIIPKIEIQEEVPKLPKTGY